MSQPLSMQARITVSCALRAHRREMLALWVEARQLKNKGSRIDSDQTWAKRIEEINDAEREMDSVPYGVLVSEEIG